MKIVTHSALISLMAVGALSLSACSSLGLGGADYTDTQVRGEQSVRIGTLESVRPVRIQSSEPGILGGLGGGVAGAALGSTIGGGNGNVAATILGALAAGAAGEAAQGALSSQNGVELTVRLDNGYVIAVTQGADESFKVGERVQVLGGSGTTRVTRLDPNSPLMNARPATPDPTGNGPSAGRAGPNNGLRFFCPDSNAYYPQVSRCPSPWMKVAP